MELGGRSSKLGDTYERVWAVRHALLVIRGEFQSLLWEPVGEDENGIDLWITANDGHRIGHQLKRQNRGEETWSVADLAQGHVLQTARAQLDRDVRSEYVFVSSCGVRSLQDLAERSQRDRVDPKLFVDAHVNTETRRKEDFDRLMLAWGLDQTDPVDVEVAFKLLQRITCDVCGRTKRVRSEVEHLAGLEIDGNATAIVATIGDLLDNKLGHEFHADELRRHIEERGFRFRGLAGHPRYQLRSNAFRTDLRRRSRRN